MGITVVPLGAGQDVGRSCLVLRVGGRTVLLDCGMHMGFKDARRFPDFSFIAPGSADSSNSSSAGRRLSEVVDAVIISHFHLDHCGALPYLTEIVGFDGPIYMTTPTRAICPILLEDFRRITSDRDRGGGSDSKSSGKRRNSASSSSGDASSEYGDVPMFTSAQIRACMRKVRPVQLNETVYVDGPPRGEAGTSAKDAFTIRAWYAGHVLGAAMFEIRCGGESVVYTGDYNMTPDRHLGAASIGRVRPDLLITESTYATTIRDSKRARERDFLKRVHDCVSRGGKVLIPVFALGRAQELMILIDAYWERMGLHGRVPIFFSAGLAERANDYYRLFVEWTSQAIRETFASSGGHTDTMAATAGNSDSDFEDNLQASASETHSTQQARNAFVFTGRIRPWDRQHIDSPGATVLFATPGMLHAGTSLEVFCRWAPNPNNLVILPGYCTVGTVGNKLLAGDRGVVAIDRHNSVHVRCDVRSLSFSAHADSKGILQLIKHAEPKNVMLVHGERAKMAFLKQRIETQCNIPCFDPANGTTVTIATEVAAPIPAQLALDLVRESWVGIGSTEAGQLRPQEIKTESRNSSPPAKRRRGTDSGDSDMSDLPSSLQPTPRPQRASVLSGVLIMEQGGAGGRPSVRILGEAAAVSYIEQVTGISAHVVTLSASFRPNFVLGTDVGTSGPLPAVVHEMMDAALRSYRKENEPVTDFVDESGLRSFQREGVLVADDAAGTLNFRSLKVSRHRTAGRLKISWRSEDSAVAAAVRKALEYATS